MDLDRNIRILVVDDSSTMRKILKTVLGELGFRNTVEADDGDTAWDLLTNDKIELIICDHKMPRVTGVEFLKMVRGDERFDCLPFIMVTAESMRENVIEAAKSGVSGYVVKPFSADTLEKKMARVFQGKASCTE